MTSPPGYVHPRNSRTLLRASWWALPFPMWSPTVRCFEHSFDRLLAFSSWPISATFGQETRDEDDKPKEATAVDGGRHADVHVSARFGQALPAHGQRQAGAVPQHRRQRSTSRQRLG